MKRKVRANGWGSGWSEELKVQLEKERKKENRNLWEQSSPEEQETAGYVGVRRLWGNHNNFFPTKPHYFLWFRELGFAFLKSILSKVLKSKEKVIVFCFYFVN